MLELPITTVLLIDDEAPVVEQLDRENKHVGYEPTEEDDEFLTEIAGLHWKELNNDQKMRVIEWHVANMVFEGTVNFNYTYVCPGKRACPICHKPMEMFDAHQHHCPDCDIRVIIKKME